MSEPMDDRNLELKEIFFLGAEELLQGLNETALSLEKNPSNDEAIREIRRIVHTLKGDSAACGFRELTEIAHTLEDAYATDDIARPRLAEIAFAAADLFAAMLVAYRGQGALPSSDRLKALMQADSSSPEVKAKNRKKENGQGAASWTEYERHAAEDAQERGLTVYHIVASIDPLCSMPIAARQLLLTALRPLGEVLASRPEASASVKFTTIEVLLASEKTEQQTHDKAHIPTVISNVQVFAYAASAARSAKGIDKNDVPSASADDSNPDADSESTLSVAQPSYVTPENVLKVDAQRIDNLLNLVGELIIGKSMLQQAMNDFARENARDVIKGKFADAMAFQARVLNDLQRSVMKVRMVPVDQLFRRFPRLVRDVARFCDKEVELTVSGQETDLDKSLLDSIAEPLTHIIRNAISHGIERSEDRILAGKPQRGELHLRALHQGNQVVVELKDDGGGIDAKNIRAKAVERGLVSREEAMGLSDSEAMDYIFHPGFSTAHEVTAVSGRGVGLDIVRSVMQRLKGTVEVESQVGTGTTFRLKLPLTLAIIKALLFRVDRSLYAIPLNAVAEITRTVEADLHQVDHYEVMQLRDEVLPLIRLGQGAAEKSERGEHRQRIFILVIHSGERKIGLIVDSLEGEEELVIKALDDNTVETDLVSGASILGDGRVVLIVNLSAVAERFAKLRTKMRDSIPSGLLLSTQGRLLQPTGTGVRL